MTAPAVDPHEFMEAHRCDIDSYIESLGELDSAGRKAELEDLFRKLAERDEQVRNRYVRYAQLWTQAYNDPFKRRRSAHSCTGNRRADANPARQTYP